MKVEMDTYNRKVSIQANEHAGSLETIDKWIKTLKVAREWLRKELQEKPQ